MPELGDIQDPPQLSIPATLIYLPRRFEDFEIDFAGEIHIMRIDEETDTPYIFVKQDGVNLKYPLDDGDIIGIWMEHLEDYRYWKLTKFDLQTGRVYKPFTNWNK
jgi:hypothetical protein